MRTTLNEHLAGRRVPIWLKVVYSLFLLALVPAYAAVHGMANFLWFSNVALMLTCLAVWLESRLLASMMAVGVLVPETAWVLDFFVGLTTRWFPLGVTDYIVDPQYPLWVRALTLYHLPLPVIMVWLVWKLGYDPRAWRWQVLLGWAVLVISYAATDPQDNINRAHGPGDAPQQWMPPLAWLGIMLAIYPLLVVLPTHILLRWLFGQSRQAR